MPWVVDKENVAKAVFESMFWLDLLPSEKGQYNEYKPTNYLEGALWKRRYSSRANIFKIDESLVIHEPCNAATGLEYDKIGFPKKVDL